MILKENPPLHFIFGILNRVCCSGKGRYMGKRYQERYLLNYSKRPGNNKRQDKIKSVEDQCTALIQ